MLAQTFSSELGTWGPCTEIRTPQIHGRSVSAYSQALRIRPLVAGGAVHWLCLTNTAGYILKLRVRAAADRDEAPGEVPLQWRVADTISLGDDGGWREPGRAGGGQRQDIGMDAVEALGEVESAATGGDRVQGHLKVPGKCRRRGEVSPAQ